MTVRMKISDLNWDESGVHLDGKTHPLHTLDSVHVDRTLPVIDGKSPVPVAPRHYALLEGPYSKQICEIDVPPEELPIWHRFEDALQNARGMRP